MTYKGLTEPVRKELGKFVKAKRSGINLYSDFAGDCFLIEIFKHEEFNEEKSGLITNVDPTVDLSTSKVGKSISAQELAVMQDSAAKLIKKGKTLKERRVFPIGKIVAIGNKVAPEYANYKVGDIVRISDSLLKPKQNPEWEAWYKETNGGQAKGIEAGPAPQRYVYGFEIFASNNSFKENPFAHVDEITPEDLFTYYIGTSYVKCKMDVSKLIANE